MSKHNGTCNPDCNHRHKHSNDCSHGVPTAIPHRGRKCTVCNGLLVNPYYCPIHFRWECLAHKRDSHGEGSWVAITRKTIAQASQHLNVIRVEPR